MSTTKVVAPIATGRPDNWWAIDVHTDAPGAVTEVRDLADGIVAEFNGNGTLVGLSFPKGIEGVSSYDDED